jgi:hypothetical protein
MAFCSCPKIASMRSSMPRSSITKPKAGSSRQMRDGRSYRSQVRFDEYVSRRQRNGDYGFRRHLKEIGAAGEV